jgi:hypothetical protein
MELPKFKPDTLSQRPNIVLLYGKRNSGKTYLINNLLKQVSYDRVIVFSNEYDVGKYATNYSVYSRFDAKVLSQVIDDQTPCSTAGHVCVVIDHCLHDTDIPACRQLEYILRNGIPKKITLIMSQSYGYSLPLSWIANIDHIFVFKNNNVNEIKREVLQFIPLNLHTPFYNYLAELLKPEHDHKALVISSQQPDIINTYKA